MLTRLERYIGFTIAKATLATLISIIILLMVFGLVDEMEDVGKGTYEAEDAFIVAAMAAPRHIFEVFPVAVLIGSLIGLGGLASHGELVAMRAAGMSIRDIVVAVLKAGVVLVLVAFIFGDFVAPPSERFATTYRAEKMQEKVTLKSEYGFWVKDGKAFVNIRSILPGGQLKDIYIYEFDDERRMYLSSYAESAQHKGDTWVLEGINQTKIDYPDGTQIRSLDSANWDALLEPELLDMLVIRPGMMPLWALYQYITGADEEQVSKEYEVAFWSKLGIPFATIVMIFLAVPFVLGHQRSAEKGQRIFFGILLGVVFYLMNRTVSYLALVYDMDPMAAGLVPGLVFLGMAIWMLQKAH